MFLRPFEKWQDGNYFHAGRSTSFGYMGQRLLINQSLCLRWSWVGVGILL